MRLPIYMALNLRQQTLIVVSRNITASVANTPCHLGEHCRCKSDDRAGCWNEVAK